MGLLDKALRLQKPPSEEKPAGLLARARKFRDFISSSPQKPKGPGLLQRALAFRDRPGLFRRAAALREKLATLSPESGPVTSAVAALSTTAAQTPRIESGPPPLKTGAAAMSEPGRGLLQRAESLREADALPAEPVEPGGFETAGFETSSSEPSGFDTAVDLSELDVPELHSAGLDVPLAPFDDDTSGGLDLDWNEEPDSSAAADLDFSDFEPGSEIGAFPGEESADKPELPGVWNDLEVPVSTDSEGMPNFEETIPGLEAAEEAAEEVMGAAADSSPAQPELAAEGASPEDFWENMDPGDPFAEFEQQAEREAEQTLAAAGDQGSPDDEEKPLFLFDADDEFTTAPVEAHIAGQKKIDHYLSLFDIAREVSAIQDFDEFWDAVLFAVMGQLGAQTVVVFAARTSADSGQALYPVAASGFDPDDSWVLKPGDRLYDLCAEEEGVLYAQNLRAPEQAVLLSEMERSIITESGAEIIAPLRNNSRMYGVVLLGATFSGDEYGIDDLEFMTLLGGLASSGVDRILARLEFDRDTETLRKRDFFHNRIMEAARDAASVRGLDELYDVLVRNLTEHFAVDSYSLVLLNPSTQEYTLFAGNRISPESMERFRLGTSSELVGMISNFTRVFDVSDFRTNGELARSYTNDDIGIMKQYWAVPLIYQNWLVGFFTIHSVRRQWTEFDREMVVSMAELLGPSFGGAIMLGERESLFRDPFSPLEDRLRLEIRKSQEFHSQLSLVEIRIKNIKRVLALNPSARVTQFLGAVGRSVAGHLLQTDFLARIGQGRFAMILPGRGKEEAEIFVKKIRNDLKRLNLLPGSPVDAQFVHVIVSAEDTTDPEKMLAILE